jgi:uncharacterized membrane protein YhaH (DUF805 family)
MQNDPGGTIEVIIGIIFLLLFIFPYFRIFQRTGHSGWWAILIVVPLVNIIMLWVFAYIRWPALDEARK